MEDRPDSECKYFIELLEWTRSSADVSEPAVDDRVEAIAPMSRSYARSTSTDAKVEARMNRPQTDMYCCHVGFEHHHLVAHSEQGVLVMHRIGIRNHTVPSRTQWRV
jgi:hypothetical protein